MSVDIDNLVSANESYPYCPRCSGFVTSEEWRGTDDRETGQCNHCRQLLMVGNVFSPEGALEAWEPSSRDWPGWARTRDEQLLEDVYSFLSKMGRSGLTLDPDLPEGFDALYEAVGKRLWPMPEDWA